MSEENQTKSKPVRKSIAPVPEEAFSSHQLSLFQSFLANGDDARSLSHAIALWDSIPRYSIARSRMEAMRTKDGFLDAVEIPFKHGGVSLTAVIHPARVKESGGQRRSFYPGAREELIEHALRKIATEQSAGFFDKPTYRSGARFSLYQLRKELERQGHSLRYDELIEGLDILSLCSIEILAGDGEDNQAFGRSTYLTALAGVKRKDYDANREARWTAQFHPLVTQSIDELTYRQFNYERLMSCSTQLARWLLSQLVLKFIAANHINTFEVRYSTVRRDSALLNGYTRERDAVAALNSAWGELKELGALDDVRKEEKRGPRSKIEDVVYTLKPSRHFVAEQKAANRQVGDAKVLSNPGQLAPAAGMASVQQGSTHALGDLLAQATQRGQKRGE